MCCSPDAEGSQLHGEQAAQGTDQADHADHADHAASGHHR